LAGVLIACIQSHGPQDLAIKGADLEAIQKSHPKKREAFERTMSTDIHSAIEFVSSLALKVIDGEYDDELEPEAVAGLWQDSRGVKHMTPISGFKAI
jgi:hypothetical protein